jgi:putative transposase
VKYAFIKRNQEAFAVTRMCDMMNVSQSAYYDWLKRPESSRSIEDRRLSKEVRKIHKKSRKTYGVRRIRQELMEDGEAISRKRIGRLMKQQGLFHFMGVQLVNSCLTTCILRTLSKSSSLYHHVPKINRV